MGNRVTKKFRGICQKSRGESGGLDDLKENFIPLNSFLIHIVERAISALSFLCHASDICLLDLQSILSYRARVSFRIF